MNSVLPSLTWGTWDDAEWAVANRVDADAATTEPKATHLLVSRRSEQRMRRKGLQAPKTSQLWFEELLERVEGTAFGRNRSKYRCNPLKCLHKTEVLIEPQQKGIPWAQLPAGLHPRDGKLPAARVRNKRHQVDNLTVLLQRILRSGDVVVEFCAGSGHVALPLAYLFPQCTFVLLDKKAPSLAIASERITAARLTNVSLFCGMIDDLDQPFDVGVALHACGEATDLVMQKCLAQRAAYVLAPCCVGKIKLSKLAYPRSATMARELSRTEYKVLAKAADFGHSSSAAVAHSDTNRRRRRCKTLLESDRNMRAEEAQYDTFMFVMHPSTATPKSDVLVGLPRHLNREATERGMPQPVTRSLQLECEATLSTESHVLSAVHSIAPSAQHLLDAMTCPVE